ncbi:hypothetical protein EK904_005831, partial [Melospiza melodia maxima]
MQLLLLDLATLQVQKFSVSKPEAVFCLLNLLQEENDPICKIKFQNILQKLKKKYRVLLELINRKQMYFFPLLLETQYKKESHYQ